MEICEKEKETGKNEEKSLDEVVNSIQSKSEKYMNEIG